MSHDPKVVSVDLLDCERSSAVDLLQVVEVNGDDSCGGSLRGDSTASDLGLLGCCQQSNRHFRRYMYCIPS